ncbi:NAD(P)/FAD-dependent oxidoreductase [Nodosilinea sp. P-1105]|nr:NAD(P)/FAD-dependent oxidoreductase [Nodosilinea sp. P-1105]
MGLFMGMPPQMQAYNHSTPSDVHQPQTRICILGGGFGGLYCALALHRYLKRWPQPVQVTLVEPRDRFTFTPLLYELLTDELKPWEIAPSYQQLLGHTSIQQRQATVNTIDLPNRLVKLHQGDSLPYDYLVVAMGSQMRPPAAVGHQGQALPFSTLADVWRLEQQLADLDRAAATGLVQVVVAGAGPSGVELACKLADRLGAKGQVTILDRRGKILRAYPEPLRQAAAKALKQRGVTVYLGAAIQTVDAATVTYQYQGQTCQQPADLVVWTVGTVPRSWPGLDPLKPSPLGQCLVRPTLQIPQDDRVFVLGDMAEMPIITRDRRPGSSAPMTAQSAYQAAPVVAHNIWALAAQRPLRSFGYVHLGDMLTLGRNNAVVCGFGLCITGRLGAVSRRWAYWLRLPTAHHRWRVLRHWLSSIFITS